MISYWGEIFFSGGAFVVYYCLLRLQGRDYLVPAISTTWQINTEGFGQPATVNFDLGFIAADLLSNAFCPAVCWPKLPDFMFPGSKGVGLYIPVYHIPAPAHCANKHKRIIPLSYQMFTAHFYRLGLILQSVFRFEQHDIYKSSVPIAPQSCCVETVKTKKSSSPRDPRKRCRIKA